MVMSNTDETLIQEFNDIMDNAEKLVVGEKYSYPKLMEALGLPVKAKGAGRVNQVKRIKQYLNWDSKTKIYSGVNEDAIPVLKKSNTSEYYELIKNCLSLELNAYIEEHKNQVSMLIGYNKLLFMCGITSSIFRLMKDSFVIEKTSKKLDVPTDTIKAYSQCLRADAKVIAENAIRNMRKEGLLEYENAVIFLIYNREADGSINKFLNENGEYVEDTTFRKATDEEVDILTKVKSKVLENMLPDVAPSNRMYTVIARNKYDDYEKDVINELKEKYNINIDGFFNGFEIDLGSFKGKCNDDFLFANLELKGKFQKKMLNSTEKVYRGTLEKNVVLDEEGLFGEAYEEAIEASITDVINKLNKVMIVGDEDFEKELKTSILEYKFNERKKENEKRIKKYKKDANAKVNEMAIANKQEEDAFDSLLNRVKNGASIQELMNLEEYKDLFKKEESNAC